MAGVGLPAALYNDHGADFTSDHITRFCADLKVQLLHSTPGAPRGRGKYGRFFARHHHRTAPDIAGANSAAQLRRPATAATMTLSDLDAAVGSG
jgi:putative transposase